MTDKSELTDSEIEDRAEAKTQQLRDLNENLMDLAKDKEQVTNELRELRQARDLMDQASGEPPMLKHIGAGYHVETDYEQVDEEVEEKISSLRERRERIEQVMNALEDEFEEARESLEELVKHHSQA